MNENISVVEFKGCLSYKEFVSFQKLLVAKWNRSYIVFPVYALIVTFMLYDRASVSPARTFLIDYLAWLALFSVLSLLIIFVRRRTWKNMMEIQGAISGELNERGITWKSSHTLTEYAWNEILRVKQSDNMLALFFSKRCAFYLPRSFFKEPADWDRAIELCRVRRK